MKFDYYHVIDGLRRKQDISRSLLEKTNGDLVNFIENLKLRNEIKKLKNE
jgi:translin